MSDHGRHDVADVTVVIPAFNREWTIERAVLSATVVQQVAPARVIVVDDGSTDATAERARRAGAEVIQQVNQGVAVARNVALNAATTRWVAFLDSDDQWLPDHLRVLTQAASTHVLVATNARVVPSGRLIGHPYRSPHPVTSYSMWWPENPVCMSAVLVDREAGLDVGGFRTFSHGEDRDLWTRLLQTGSGLLLPAVTCIYHEHPDQRSADPMSMRRARWELLGTYRSEPWLEPRLMRRIQTGTAWDNWRFDCRRHHYREAADALRAGFFSRSTVTALRELRGYRRRIGRL